MNHTTRRITTLAATALTVVAFPVGASGQSEPTDDTTAPRVTLKAPAEVTKAKLRKGLPVTIGCSEACYARVQLAGPIGIVTTKSTSVAAGQSKTIKLRAQKFQTDAMKSGSKYWLALEASDEADNKAGKRRAVRVR